MQNFATGDCPNRPWPSLCDINQRPYSTKKNNHLTTGHFSGTSILGLKNYNPYLQLVADATKSGRPLTAHREYDNLRYCSDQLLPKPTIKKSDGDSMDYWAFLNRFTCHVADWLPSQKKFSYLMQHCSERVRQHIQHFSDLHDGRSPYDLAWEELHCRNGQACEECLLEFPRIDRDIAERLNKLSILMKRSSYALNPLTFKLFFLVKTY